MDLRVRWEIWYLFPYQDRPLPVRSVVMSAWLGLSNAPALRPLRPTTLF